MTIAQYKQFDKLKKPKKHKYNAKQTIIDGIKFPSKKEAEYYKDLKIQKQNGNIEYFLRQVPFHLPGNIKYLCDFMIVDVCNRIHFIDVKGRDTPMSKLKRKQCEQIYGIEIEVV